MHRKAIFLTLIISGSVLLLAAITFWFDSLTSFEPDGLGQNILKWATTIIDIVVWLSAYLVKKNDGKSTTINISGGSPLVPTGDHNRIVQVNNGNFVEKQEFNINIAAPSEEDIEKKKRKSELRNKHEFDAPRYLYRPIQETLLEFQNKLEKLSGGYIGVFGPPGSGKSTFLTQTLRTLPVRSIRYYAYVPDAQDPSILRGESINFFHDTTLQIQKLRNSHEDRPDPTDRIALNEFFYQQLNLLGKDFEDTNTKTIILIDGLDHITREQHPNRSLIEDLPSPSFIPPGVYIVLGSQPSALPNLPVGVQNVFSKSERTIQMGKLSHQNVFEIIHQTLPDILRDFDQKIYQVVDGHPLSLIYLLNSLFQAESPEDYQKIIQEALVYQGNIEDQYFAHWKKIEGDFEFSEFLGMLARIRGPIPVNWIAKWTQKSLLLNLRESFGQYFSSDSLDRWEFFHNSFRIFLESKTADDLPGRNSKQIDQGLHLKLAQLYEESDAPYQWETLYHYFKAGDYKRVVEIAQYAWFRAQVEALRPIDAIETDVRLATKAAGELLDAVALLRYTLLGASLQQRADVLKNTHLPHLLIEIGKQELAIDYARDGTRLRLEDREALSFARKVFVAGLKREAIRIFELAEPLEYLSGRPIAGGHDQPRNLYDLLSEWVKSASLIRGSMETIKTIRRIQKEPAWNDEDKDLLLASRGLQNWLLFKGALSCCERKDWNGWTNFCDALDEKHDFELRYYALLRTIEYLRRINDTDRAKDLLDELVKITDIPSFGTGRHEIADFLSVAESVYFLGDKDLASDAKTWVDKTPMPPLSDQEVHSQDNSPALFHLQFRYARLRFLLEDSISPDSLLRESEAKTVFGDYEDDDTRLARRQLALIAFTLASLWVNGHLNHEDNGNEFLNKTKWIFDLAELGWASRTATFRLETEGVKAEIARCIVACAAQYGKETLQTLQQEFSLRWANEPSVWWAGIQRETVVAFTEYVSNHEWAKHQLTSLETIMLQDLDVNSRVEECEKQATAWLRIGELQFALLSLNHLIKTARGIYHDEDYQLIRWAKWLRSTNEESKINSIDRILSFINKIVSVENNAPGVDDALNVCLQAVFDLSPQKAVMLFKELLEQKSVKHADGLSHLLLAALDVDNPPSVEVFEILQNLILPFERDSPSLLIKTLINVAYNVLGVSATFELCQRLVNQIEICVPANQRYNWLSDVADGMAFVGLSFGSLSFREGNVQKNFDSNHSTLDHDLHLKTGEMLTPDNARRIIRSAADLEKYLNLQDNKRTSYFEWHKLAIRVILNSASPTEILRVCSILEGHITDYKRETDLSRVLSEASSRLFELGDTKEAADLAEKAFSLTRPSGWAINWDGSAKYEVMEVMISVIGERAREKLLSTYALDLSERFPNPEQIIRYSEELTQILFEKIPYPIIWLDLEQYLDELFAGVSVQRQTKIESLLNIVIDPLADSAHNALAQLLVFYLDFPAFPVSTGAIKASARLVMRDNSAVLFALSNALNKNNQLTMQCLIALEVVSLKTPEALLPLKEQVAILQVSPNYIVRSLATKILNNIVGQSSQPLRIERKLPSIYSIVLPEIAVHDTIDSMHGDLEPVLIGDRAAIIQPLDIEARKLARRANLPEENVIYHVAEKFKELQISRTWLSNQAPLSPDELSIFLEKVNLIFAHNKPKIAPAKHAVAFVAAELYDSGILSESDYEFLESIFRDNDPGLLDSEAVSRPDFIERIGGLTYHEGGYTDIPKDWERTLENSLSYLRSKTSDGKIILGEWTHLKRLQDNWPTEERISVMRAASPLNIWDYKDPYDEHLPVANGVGLRTIDYLDMTNFPASELVIAHNGFSYQMEEASWLALNPRIGFDMGWKPIELDWFAWQNKDGQVMARSIFWQDGNFNSFGRFDRVEVGYGWLVLINEKAYQEIRKRFGAIARGGVIRRSLGWAGTVALTKYASRLDIP